jgi:hypothetical protein
MPRGGARAGAGRKPGQRNAKTLELLKQAAALGITPLQVMLENMKTCYVSGDLQGAHKAAVDAAPYLHAKLVSSQVTVRRPDEMSDDELIAAIAVDEPWRNAALRPRAMIGKKVFTASAPKRLRQRTKNFAGFIPGGGSCL